MFPLNIDVGGDERPRPRTSDVNTGRALRVVLYLLSLVVRDRAMELQKRKMMLGWCIRWPARQTT